MVGSKVVHSKRAIKYLGVMIDTKLYFKEHLKYMNEKAVTLYSALSRIMLNTRAPKQERRRLLMSSTRAAMLYAAPVFHEALKKPSYYREANSTYRLCAIRVACAFRTVSDEATMLIAGMIPFSELVEKAKKLRETESSSSSSRGQARRESMLRWKRSWTASSKGRWTYSLIPEVEPWILRKHGQVTYYLTKVLSGHGCFRAYLKRFTIEKNDECTWCGRGVMEDAQHVLFECSRLHSQRLQLKRVTGTTILVANLVPLMLNGQKEWNAVCSFSETIMVMLRSLERRRNAE
ncbi:hypothetical protein KR222_006686 [Zaprionus bogoriensis]|nr:hypothetical protein KR222_006686 [Zaprionus bogoriensis]